MVSLPYCLWSVCLPVVSLSTCAQSVYLWSVCLLVVSLPHYLWSVCLPVVSLSTCGQSVYLWAVYLTTCGQSVYLWSVYMWSVCLLVMMAEKDHHCTEPNHRVKLRCEVTMQSFKTRSEAAKLRCEATMQSYELTMQSYDAKLRCKVQIKLCIVTSHIRNFASSLFSFNLSIIDLFIRK